MFTKINGGMEVVNGQKKDLMVLFSAIVAKFL